jgi:hypothetical protein
MMYVYLVGGVKENKSINLYTANVENTVSF